ncbi:hypothetical protein [Paenibacillus sp. DYY-L-2]|uniref:hypothetical protein n=1 Tax=Paenibacillus sp. DYY-L-2 TaxID=3447013 RepID=UPI003F4FAEE8
MNWLYMSQVGVLALRRETPLAGLATRGPSHSDELHEVLIPGRKKSQFNELALYYTSQEGFEPPTDGLEG